MTPKTPTPETLAVERLIEVLDPQSKIRRLLEKARNLEQQRDEANKAQKQDHKTMLAIVRLCQDNGVILGSPEVIEAVKQLDRIIDERDLLLARMDECGYPEMLQKQNELKTQLAAMREAGKGLADVLLKTGAPSISVKQGKNKALADWAKVEGGK